MEEEQIRKTPPVFNGRLIKILTLTLFFHIVLFSVGFLGLETTSSSKFCSSCHEMKPEYYTWKASSHSEVDCVSCHTGSTKEDYAKAKANGLVQVYKTATNSYTAPIIMPDQIPNAVCEKCHNLTTRDVTPTGDLIIPHDKHSEEGIACTKCHSGVSHGKIAERKVTYKSDYEKWDEALGESIMRETKFLKPEMETCMECHELRNVSNTCETCHQTTMLPDTHRSESFKMGGHGKIQPSEVQKCDKCHAYMSKDDFDFFKEKTDNYTSFLNKNHSKAKQPTVSEYAKANTFCKDCHGQRPKSHKQDLFLLDHGRFSDEKKNCFTCHDNRIVSDAPVTTVACASCHSRTHTNGWKDRHPVPLTNNQKLQKSCLQCHVEETCMKCHSISDKKMD